MPIRFALRCALLPLVLFGVVACGGTKLVKQPAQDAASPLESPAVAQVEDGRLRASFHSLVLRNGPGSWAKNAAWDEYHLQVTNVSAQPVQIVGAAVVDSIGTRLPALDDRRQLLAASKQSAGRYRKQNVKVTTGPGSAGLILTGAGVAVAGVGLAVGPTYGSLLGGSVGAGYAAAGALVLAAPVLAVAGIVRAVHNGQVDDELARRAPDWPLELAPGETRALDVFVPLAPSPARIELDYEAGAAHRLELDVQTPLAGLHLPPAADTGAAR